MIIDIRNERDVKTLARSLLIDEIPVIGLTSGTFDLFHTMHLTYLKRCRRFCDFLIVGVDSDDLVRENKGPERPIVSEHHRVSIVAELNCVDAAFVLGSLSDFRTAVDSFGVKTIFRNGDVPAREVVGADKATVRVVHDIIHASSTSAIIEEIKKRKTAEKHTLVRTTGSEPANIPTLLERK